MRFQVCEFKLVFVKVLMIHLNNKPQHEARGMRPQDCSRPLGCFVPRNDQDFGHSDTGTPACAFLEHPNQNHPSLNLD